MFFEEVAAAVSGGPPNPPVTGRSPAPGSVTARGPVAFSKARAHEQEAGAACLDAPMADSSAASPSTSKPPVKAGFARIPHALLGDTVLSAMACRTAGALEFFACTRLECWPSNKARGEHIGVDEGTIGRALIELEARRWIKRRTVKPARGNMTGRIVKLLWNSPPPTANGPLSEGIAGVIRGVRAARTPLLKLILDRQTGFRAGAEEGSARRGGGVRAGADRRRRS